MKEKKKIIIISASAVVIIAIIIAVILINTNKKQTAENTITYEFAEVKEDGTLVNKSEKIKEIHTVNNIELSNIEITEKDGVTCVNAVLKNTTSEKIESFDAVIRFLDKEGMALVGFGTVIPTLEAGEEATLSVASDGQYANVDDIFVYKIEE